MQQLFQNHASNTDCCILRPDAFAFFNKLAHAPDNCPSNTFLELKLVIFATELNKAFEIFLRYLFPSISTSLMRSNNVAFLEVLPRRTT
jgi:hypothetical protein